jgi:hypothetical protein
MMLEETFTGQLHNYTTDNTLPADQLSKPATLHMPQKAMKTTVIPTCLFYDTVGMHMQPTFKIERNAVYPNFIYHRGWQKTLERFLQIKSFFKTELFINRD